MSSVDTTNHYRYILIESDPTVVRDTESGFNYHLRDHSEAKILCEILNTYEEVVRAANSLKKRPETTHG